MRVLVFEAFFKKRYKSLGGGIELLTFWESEFFPLNQKANVALLRNFPFHVLFILTFPTTKNLNSPTFSSSCVIPVFFKLTITCPFHSHPSTTTLH
jgi:hypothetical protein